MFNCIVLKNKIEVNSFPRRNVLPQRGAGKSDSKFQKIFLFYFFIQAAMYGMWGSQLPGQGLNLCSLHWEHGVLTTGPPGKPRKNVFSKKKKSRISWVEKLYMPWRLIEGSRTLLFESRERSVFQPHMPQLCILRITIKIR